MNIAIASGKGGTGKTTIAVALAQAFEKENFYLDCDVEEPNGLIFLAGESESVSPVNVLVPSVDKDLCNNCGKCSKACQFNAIASLPSVTMVFNEMCHSCGMCSYICPQKAITEVEREIGELKVGLTGNINFIEGRLNIGHMMAPPIIRSVKKKMLNSNKSDLVAFIDSPPGTACPMISAVQDSDYVILVTEPTPFGLHDLKLAVETVKALSIPCGVIINRSNIGDGRVVDYCKENGIDLLLEIPESRAIAEAYSEGYGMLEAAPELKPVMNDLVNNLINKYGDIK